MVAVFHAGPVATDQSQPLFGAICFGRATRQVVAAVAAGLAGLFDRALAAHHDQAAGKGEVGRQGLEGKGMEASHFDPAVTAVGLDKKGVLGKASRPRARWSKCGWLPLIWVR